jgi:hypothetical protein
VLLALIAAYMLVIGVKELAIAIGGKRLLNDQLERALLPSPPSPRASREHGAWRRSRPARPSGVRHNREGETAATQPS